VEKLIIFSIVLVSFGTPIWLAVSKQPRRAFRRMQGIILLFIVVWSLMCLRWYPQLVQLQ
jgi:hypothetical protein